MKRGVKAWLLLILLVVIADAARRSGVSSFSEFVLLLDKFGQTWLYVAYSIFGLALLWFIIRQPWSHPEEKKASNTEDRSGQNQPKRTIAQ